MRPVLFSLLLDALLILLLLLVLYGWSGKLYSILLVVALVYLVRPGLAKEDVGLTLRQNDGFLMPAAIVVSALVVWALNVGLCSPKG